MEELNGRASAGDPEARAVEVPPSPEVSEEERLANGRVEAFLTYAREAQEAVDRAKRKVEKTEDSLESAKEALRQAEADLAVFEGRE